MPCIRFRTLLATAAGCSSANRMSVDKKFLHFFFAVFGDICVGVLG
ncbi:hypothetical protein X975_13212, partial [Stegodyphus mimosarum]